MTVVLAERFELRERIGDGTFAEVWRALDRAAPRECRTVALKIFRPLPRNLGPEGWDPVFREIAAGLALPPHRNLVRAWALFEADFFAGEATPCLVLDHVEGGNLALWLAAQPAPGPTQLGRRLAVLRGLLAAIAHAHAHGVVHQDISFGNVLVEEGTEPVALLTDFGCALAPGLSAGEPEPENPAALQPIIPPPYRLDLPFAEAAGRDLYAFATLCYLALVGRHPLSDDWQSMRPGSWRGPPVPHASLPRRRLHDLAPWAGSLPAMRALSDLLLPCLAPEPEQRRLAAGELQAAWQAAVGPLTTHVTPSAPA